MGTLENMGRKRLSTPPTKALRIAAPVREDSNFIPDNGDRAEILVAAITKYYKESV